MTTKLSELIKEGNEIKNGIYADNGGGFYATFLFNDHNKYIKWAINSIRYIENNFSKDENYIKFKETLEVIDKNVTPTEFNKLLFILEYYNTASEDEPKVDLENNQFEEVLYSIKGNTSESEYNELKNIINSDTNETKQIMIGKLNSLGTEKLSNIIASILFNLKR
ncbi:MAG: hypothetical protein WCR29_05770 [Bacteroidales bacterium]